MSLLKLPDELLEAVVRYLGPDDTIAFGSTCKHVYTIADSPLVWSRHCIEARRYWHPKHKLEEKLQLPVAQTEWRQLFTQRARLERDLLVIFDDVLRGQQGRYHRIEQISSHGRDAMDVLARVQDHTPDSAPDVLARRYYAIAIQKQIRRAEALDIWLRLGRGEEVGLGMALGAYDMFVYATSGRSDAKDLLAELEKTAQNIRSSRGDFDTLSTRERALLIAEHLRSDDLLGMRDETKYHALGNNFLSQAFTSHSSLPLQSVGLYCAIAQQLGVDATPSNFPQHVHAVIWAPHDQTLDGPSRDPNNPPAAEQLRMFMDPWRNSEEVPEEQLRLRLTQMGISRSEHMRYLGAASVAEMTLRTARNIMVSVEEARHRPDDPSDPHAFPYVEEAWYAMLWVMVILGDADNRAAFTRRRQFIPYLVQHFQSQYPEDIPLIEVVPTLFHDRREHSVLQHMVAANREDDSAERTVTQRNGRNAGVQYKVGHHFRHRRYGYEGFVIGWDSHCAAGEQWINQMRVDELPRGRGQPFYNVV